MSERENADAAVVEWTRDSEDSFGQDFRRLLFNVSKSGWTKSFFDLIGHLLFEKIQFDSKTRLKFANDFKKSSFSFQFDFISLQLF